MINTDQCDTFVFAPFMLEQIESIKSENLKYHLYKVVCQYGCYGQHEPIPDLDNLDPTGALRAVLKGFFKAIDRAKASRKLKQEAGRKGGSVKGKCNNPNGRRGKELSTTKQELSTTKQELSYNEYMDNDSVDNDSVDLTEEKEEDFTPSPEGVPPGTKAPGALKSANACKRERKKLNASSFMRLWGQLPLEFQLSRGAQKNESAKKSRCKNVRAWLENFCHGKSEKEAVAALQTLMRGYIESPISRERPHQISYIDHFLRVADSLELNAYNVNTSN